MKLENGLKSTHLLKKTTYKMLRKLHSLEYRGSLPKSQSIGGQYCVSLYLSHMSDIIRQSFECSNYINNLCNQIDLLALSIQKQKRVNRALLVNCLKMHTYVFNKLENNHIIIKQANEIISEVWTKKCLASYVCQFGNDI